MLRVRDAVQHPRLAAKPTLKNQIEQTHARSQQGLGKLFEVILLSIIASQKGIPLQLLVNALYFWGTLLNHYLKPPLQSKVE